MNASYLKHIQPRIEIILYGMKFFLMLALMFLSINLHGQYCTAGPSSTADSNVETVGITGETMSINYTGCSPAINNLEDQTAMMVDFVVGNTYTLSVTFGTCGGNYGGVGEAWIDWDGSDSFETGEMIGTSSGTPGTAPWDAPVDFVFTVPASVVSTTRMRVMQWEGGTSPLDPCGTYIYGSAVDFTVNTTTSTASCPIVANVVTEESISCNGLSDGSVLAVVSGGTGSYIYSWSDGQTTERATNLSAGTYTVTVSDPTGTCPSVTATIELTEPTVLESSITILNNVSCNGGSDGVATATETGGSGGYTYLWSDGQTTETATGLTAGVYTVTVTDANGCDAIAPSAMITQPTAVNATINSADVNHVSCFGENTGSATVTASGGTVGITDYGYEWQNSTGTVVSIEAMVTELFAGNYTVIVTDENGCTGTNNLTITEPTALSVTITSSNLNCSGDSDGEAYPTVTGGTGSYAYSWSDGQTTEIATGLSAGDYTVTVTDDNACTVSGTVTVAEGETRPIAVITPTGTELTCDSMSIDLDAGASTSSASPPDLTYEWFSGPVLESITEPGSYGLTVTDANGCTDTTSVVITQDTISPIVIITPTATELTCDTTNIDLDASNSIVQGTASYLWDDATTTATLSITTSDTYRVTITDDDNGCTAAASISINEDFQTPTATIFTNPSTTELNCNIPSIELNASNSTVQLSTVYQWNGGTTDSITLATAAGDYTVTITDTDNGCTSTASITITSSSAVSANTTVISNVTCNGGIDGSASVTGSGGNITSSDYSYLWDVAAGSQATATAINLSAGIYMVTVTDNNGCEAASQVEITEPDAIAVIISDTDISCFGLSDGSATANPSGGTADYNFLWSNNETTATITDLPEGTYTVTVTDVNGCTGIGETEITTPTLLTITEEDNNPTTCFGGSDGSATVTASGGTTASGEYDYLWDDSMTQSSTTATGLTAGNYAVTVTDDNGCTASIAVIIDEPTELNASISILNHVSCNGGNDGVATAMETGGSGGYTYLWSDGQTTETATGFAIGTYNLTVTDGNGCEAIAPSITITEPTIITVDTVDVTDVSCFGESTGSASVTVSGGTVGIAGYAYEWQNSSGIVVATNATASGLSADDYTIMVTDENGCTGTTNLTITEPTTLSVIITNNNITCFGGNDGEASPTVTGGTGSYAYSWSDGQTTAIATGLSAGDYTLTVTDDNNCTISGTVTIGDGATLPIAVITSATTELTCDSISIDLDAASSTSSASPTDLTYEWFSGSILESITEPGSYGLTVTDVNGCQDSTVIIITQDTISPTAIINPSAIELTCDTVNIDLDASNSIVQGTANYLWDNATTTTAVLSIATPNTYRVTVTDDDNGCTDVAFITIGEDVQLPTAAISLNPNTTELTCNIPSIELDASASTVQLSSVYQWSDSTTDSTTFATAAGNYTVTITDTDNGCTSTASITITSSSAVTANTTVISNVTCNGGIDGSTTVTGSGGNITSDDYSYQWDAAADNQTTATATNLSAGIYFVTVTDNNGCEAVAQVEITEPDAIAVIISDTDISCFGLSDGSATANPSGGTADYNFLWSNNETTATITDLSEGTYTVTVTDINGCTGTGETEIITPTILTITEEDNNPTTCFGGSDGSATIVASGGITASGEYDYLWNDSMTQSTTAIGLTADNYAVTVTDDNGCTASIAVIIDEPTELNASIIILNHVSCNGGNDGIATATETGGSGGYTYLWNDGQTTETVTGLAAGNYTVTVTDANGCETIASSITITEPTTITVDTIDVIHVSCFGESAGSASVTASGGTIGVAGYAYEWQNAGGTTVSTNATATGLSVGDYTIIVTDENGCTEMTNLTIIEPTALSVLITNNNVTCSGGNDGEASPTVTGGTGSYTYSWSDGQTTAIATGLSAGDYTLTVTDENDCSISETVTIEDGTASLTINIIPSNTEFTCTITSINLDASSSSGQGALAFDWSDGSQGSNIDIENSGDYTVTVTDSSTGCTALSIITINSDELSPMVTLESSSPEISCNITNVTLTTSATTQGTASYEWEDGTTDISLEVIEDGDYMVTVTDSDNGCTTETSITINDNRLTPSVTIHSSSEQLNCNTSNIILDASLSTDLQGENYEWNDDGGNTLTATSTLNVTTAGVYTVVITNDNGCTATASQIIENYGFVTISSIVSDSVTCNGESNGSATVVASGGYINSGAYGYLWDAAANNQTSATATNLSAGTYTVTVTDDNGCSATGEVEVMEPEDITMDMVSTDVSCFGLSDGSATVTVSGGTTGATDYNYQWEDETNTIVSTSNTATNLAAGTYVVMISDDNGCKAATQVLINEPTIITATIDTNDIIPVSCNGGNTGSATVTVSGGTIDTNGYQYEWRDSAGVVVSTAITATNLIAGTYEVTVTDDNGCEATTQVEITEPTIVVATIEPNDVTPVSCNGENTGSATVTASGGTTGINSYQYEWKNASGAIISTNANASNLVAGTYTVVVFDNNGCEAIAQVEITEPTEVTATINSSDVTHVSCDGQSNGSAIVTVSGGTTDILGYQYQWSDNNSQTTATAINLSSGIYTVTVTDDNGCTASVSTTINEGTAYPDVTISASTTELTCSKTSIDLIANASVTGTYSWSSNSNATGNTLNVSIAGTYTVTVTDDNGCASTTDITITENVNAPVASISSSTTQLTCNTSNILLDASLSTGLQGANYYWNNENGDTLSATAILNVTIAGTYTVVITNDNGCISEASQTIVDDGTVMIAAIVADTITCNGGNDGSATVTGMGGNMDSGAYSYLWDEAANSQTSATATNLSAGTYSVTVTDDNGCTATADITVIEPDELNAPIVTTTPVIICEGESVTLTLPPSNQGTTIEWYSDTLMNALNSGDSFIILTPSTGTTTYWVQEVNAAGCASPFESIDLEVTSVLDITLSIDDSELCEGEETTISVTELTNADYNWTGPENFVSTLPSFTTGEAGTYTVDVTMSGCSTTDSIALVVHQNPALIDESLIEINPLCEGDDLTLFEGSQEGVLYQWTTPNGMDLNGFSVPTVADSDAGIYSLILADDNCESEIYLTELIVNPSPEANAGEDQTINQGETTGLVATGGSGFAWTPENLLDNSTIPNPTTLVDALDIGNTTFVVTVTNDFNCSDTDTIIVTVNAQEELEIYEIFTPNGDASNDNWKINYLDNINEYTLVVYDRGGYRLLETSNYYSDFPDGWDGTYNGNPVPSGTYWYVIQTSDKEYKGAVTIKR